MPKVNIRWDDSRAIATDLENVRVIHSFDVSKLAILPLKPQCTVMCTGH